MIGAMAIEDLTMNKAVVPNRSRNQSLNPNLARPSTMGTDRASNAAALRSSFPTGSFVGSGAQMGETYPNIGIYGKRLFSNKLLLMYNYNDYLAVTDCI